MSSRAAIPALQPEKTDTYSAGLVYTPKWLPGFTVTADWYQIYTKDVILPAANAAQLLVTLNIADPDLPQGGANGITRDPNDGTLLSVDSANANSAKRLVQGLDITATYEIPTAALGHVYVVIWLEPLLHLESRSRRRDLARPTSWVTSTPRCRLRREAFRLTRPSCALNGKDWRAG